MDLFEALDNTKKSNFNCIIGMEWKKKKKKNKDSEREKSTLDRQKKWKDFSYKITKNFEMN